MNNQPTPAQAERLHILAEECAEVAQACMKALRFGLEQNRDHLAKEAGDVLAAINLVTAAGDIDREAVAASASSKPERMRPWLRHQLATTPAQVKAVAPEAVESEAIAQLRHLCDDIVVTYEDEHGLALNMVADGKRLLFSNLISAVRGLIAAQGAGAEVAVMRQGGIPVGFIGERNALAALRDDIDSLPLHAHKRKVVRDWICAAISRVESEASLAAQGAPAMAEAASLETALVTQFGSTTEYDELICAIWAAQPHYFRNREQSLEKARGLLAAATLKGQA